MLKSRHPTLIHYIQFCTEKDKQTNKPTPHPQRLASPSKATGSLSLLSQPCCLREAKG